MLNFRKIISEQKPFIVLLAIIIVMSFASSFFFTIDNITNILIQASIYGIMACGMTFAIIGGDFDLSVGSIMALSGLISVLAEPYTGQVFSYYFGYSHSLPPGSPEWIFNCKMPHQFLYRYNRNFLYYKRSCTKNIGWQSHQQSK